MKEMLDRWAEDLELIPEPERELTPMVRRLFYEVTGERFSADDYRGEDSDEFNTGNPPVKPAEEALLQISESRFLRPQADDPG